MKLIDILEIVYDNDEWYIDYVLKHLEVYSRFNPHLHDRCRYGIIHNGAVERLNLLTGLEDVHKGIYSFTTYGHDGREVMREHISHAEAKEWELGCRIGDNPFINACEIVVVE